jgi:heat shock protein HslJ/cell division septation protein DedD
MIINDNQSKLRITAQNDQYSVAPGDNIAIPLLLSNEGSLPDQVRVSVEGIPLVWASAQQQVILLQPGEQAQTILSVHPPASPEGRSGRYSLKVLASSVIDPARSTQTQITLTIAGFEVKGRISVLLDSVQFSVVPGEKLEISAVLINQGFTADSIKLEFGNLPEDWTTIPEQELRLQPGEVKDTLLIIQPPRNSNVRASRYPFRILVSSQDAPNQDVSIDCTLTVVAFTEFKSALEAAQPEQKLPARVVVQNLSNLPASFNLTWKSPEDSLTFEPKGSQQLNVPSGESAKADYTAQPSRRPLFGSAKSYPYSVDVQVSGGQTQTHEGTLMSKALLPVWTGVVGGVVLLLLILIVLGRVLFPGSLKPSPATATPTVTSTATVPVPTATQSQIDQKPLLIEREWYLVAFNNTRSSPGVQEAYTLFNPDGTLIGYTGCKDLNAQYQTNYNQISITNLSLGSGVCPDDTLQQQESTMVAILRSARSYLVADTALQIGGDAGFLNYSLTPLNRAEETQPPQAVIKAVSQSPVGQVVVFDGSASSGQVPLVSWRWEFGDSVTASGIVVQHTYITAGTFTVRLTVTDQRGQTGSSTAQIVISQLPTATLTPTVPPPTATAPQPTQPPEQPTYTPGPTAQAPTSTPEPPPAPIPPQANISGPSQGFIGEPVILDASASQPGSNPITSFSWSLGNGESLPASPQSTVSFIYKAAGDYEVTVTVLDSNGLSSQATTRIKIDARLDTDVWTLSTIDTKPILPGTAITLQFKQGELAGFAGCNEYTGEYTAVDNGDGTYTISIDKLETTRLSCPRDIMDQEEHYLTILDEATQATIKENEIILVSPTGELEFYLIEAP